MPKNTNPYTMRTKDVVQMVLEQAEMYSLRSEVRAEAMAILKGKP
jgi:hypothetical protein